MTSNLLAANFTGNPNISGPMNWSDPASWYVNGNPAGTVPSETDHVTIDGSHFVIIIDVADNIDIASLSIINSNLERESRLEITSGKLTVTGDIQITNNGVRDINLLVTNGTLHCKSNITFLRDTDTNTSALTTTIGLDGTIQVDNNLLWLNKASGQEDTKEIVLNDNAALKVNNECTFRTQGGKNIEVELEGTSTFNVVNSTYLNNEGGESIFIRLTSGTPHFTTNIFSTTQTVGGLVSRVDIQSGKFEVTGTSSFSNGSNTALFELVSFGSNSEIWLTGDVNMTPNYEGTTKILVNNKSKIYIGANVNRTNNRGHIFMDDNTDCIFNGTAAQT